VAYDPVGATASLGSKSITVNANTAPFGNVDTSVSETGGTSTVAQNTNLWVNGWAVDQQDGAPVARVEIRIDGNAVANATLGVARPDVATAWGNAAYTNSGFQLTYNIGTLSAGSHTVSAAAYDSAGATSSLGSKSITVSTNTPPFGNLDTAVSEAGGTNSVAQNTSLWVNGWAADQQDGAPLARVEVRVDGVAVGDATLGYARPDVATAWGNAAYTNSGFQLAYNIGALSLGSHTVTAIAYDSSAAIATLGQRTITVTSP
jgi:hypothetical protein